MAYADLSYDELIDRYVEVSQTVADLRAGHVYHFGWMNRLDVIREELSSRNSQWMTHVMERRLRG